MKTRKAALVYSGQPRNLKDCWENHRKTFMDANPGWEIDVFAHLWFDESWERDSDWNRLGYAQTEIDSAQQKNIDSAKSIGTLDTDIKSYIGENWKPKAIRFAPPRAFDYRELGVVGGKDPHKANNALSMFYGMEQANKLKREYENAHGFQYDCVVRMRTDIVFLDSPVVFDKYDLEKINIRRHMIPGWQIDDRFAFANSAAMDKFCAVFSNLHGCARKNLAPGKNMANARDVFNAHEVLGYHAEVVQGLQIAKHNLPVEMHRLRNFGMFFSDAPADKEPFYRLRLQAIKNIFGEQTAAKLQTALRVDLGLTAEKISLADLYALQRAYLALLPAPFAKNFRHAIKDSLQSLTYRGEKVPAKYVWNYYRYKLKAFLKSKPR